MPLYKNTPEPSARMGLMWTIGTIGEAAILEFGSMGHMIYAEKWMSQSGIRDRSKLYTTHLDEKDIALGITKRIETAIAEIVLDPTIKAIFLLPSSVPEMIGIDMEAICEELQCKYEKISIIAFSCGNFKDNLSKGIEEGLYRLAKSIPKSGEKSSNNKEKDSLKKIRFNLIGSACDTARFQSDARELVRILKGAFAMEEICILTSDTSITQIERMGLSDINIVIRKEGIKAAKELQKRFQTPYFYERPYGYEGTLNWVNSIGKQIEKTANQEFLMGEMEEGKAVCEYCRQMAGYFPNKAKIQMNGNEDIALGILAFACEEIGLRAESGGIYMANERELRSMGAVSQFAIERSLNSYSFNSYESPFVGFRGAMKLCSLWLTYLLN